MTMKNVIYFGNSPFFLMNLSVHTNVSLVVCEEKAFEEISSAICRTASDVKVITANTKTTRSVVISLNLKDIDFCIMHGFGHIFSLSEVSYLKNVINFHFGDIPLNRGRHPLQWSILLNSEFFTCTAHLIDEKLDMGKLIYQLNIPRFGWENSKDAALRLYEEIAKSGFIASTIKKYCSGLFLPIKEGEGYRKNINKLSCDIDCGKFTSDFVCRLIDIQRDFNSTVSVQGKSFNAYIHPDVYSNSQFKMIDHKKKDFTKFVFSDGMEIVLYMDERIYLEGIDL
jgi:methionyl-tRNA formyltransferase